ncbi:MAG TPA: hypothetical protein VEG61_04765 [Candidatus Dormibacteraeota bacterium]|nr:hypothetical protein [Candidatus Dormibacteraeota bacterium]
MQTDWYKFCTWARIILVEEGRALARWNEDAMSRSLEMREIAENALRLQRFLLRRAWGVLYAAWAVSIFMTLFGIPIVVTLLRLSAEFTVAVSIALSMLSSGAAVIVTLRAFKRVRDTAEIHGVITKETWAKVLGNSVLVPVGVTIYLIFISSILLFGTKTVVFLLLVIYAAMAVYLSFGLGCLSPRVYPSRVLWRYLRSESLTQDRSRLSCSLE